MALWATVQVRADPCRVGPDRNARPISASCAMVTLMKRKCGERLTNFTRWYVAHGGVSKHRFVAARRTIGFGGHSSPVRSACSLYAVQPPTQISTFIYRIIGFPICRYLFISEPGEFCFGFYSLHRFGGFQRLFSAPDKKQRF